MPFSTNTGKTMSKPSPTLSLLLLCLLVLTPPHPIEALISLTQLRTLLSLSHSLSSRVANLRASRGDLEGARRAHFIASKLDHGLSVRFWPSAFCMAWDYLRNYAWHDAMSFQDAFGIVADLNELLSALSELASLKSDSERAAWFSRNYKNVLRVFKSISNRLLSVFRKSGPLRELVEILQKEMTGESLKDYLEVGTNDLKGLIQILKDLASQYAHVEDHQEL